MQSRLFRYEIDQALVNPVFQATDPDTGKTVFLHEWTPPAAERDAAKLRLEEVADQLACEVFTADASLYLAAPSREAAKVAIQALQAHDLFPGDWLDRPRALAVAPPAYSPAPPPFAPSPALATWDKVPPAKQQKYVDPPTFASAPKRNPATGCLLVLLGLLIMVVGGMICQSFIGGLVLLGIYTILVIYSRHRSQ